MYSLESNNRLEHDGQNFQQLLKFYSMSSLEYFVHKWQGKISWTFLHSHEHNWYVERNALNVSDFRIHHHWTGKNMRVRMRGQLQHGDVHKNIRNSS